MRCGRKLTKDGDVSGTNFRPPWLRPPLCSRSSDYDDLMIWSVICCLDPSVLLEVDRLQLWLRPARHLHQPFYRLQKEYTKSAMWGRCEPATPKTLGLQVCVMEMKRSKRNLRLEIRCPSPSEIFSFLNLKKKKYISTSGCVSPLLTAEGNCSAAARPVTSCSHWRRTRSVTQPTGSRVSAPPLPSLTLLLLLLLPLGVRGDEPGQPPLVLPPVCGL